MTVSTTALPDRFVYAAIVICAGMMPAVNWMPSFLGVVHQGYGIDTRQLGQLAFMEMGGLLLGTLFTSGKSMSQLVRWVWIACAALVIVNAALLIPGVASSLLLMPMRSVTGFAAGIGCGYAFALCGMSRHPTRNFGLYTAFMGLLSLLGFQLIAYLVAHSGVRDGVADIEALNNVARMIFGCFILLAGAAALVLLANKPSHGRNETARKLRVVWEPKVIVGLLAILFAYIARGAVYAFLQVLGMAHGFSVGDVASAMSVFALTGIGGSLLAAAVPAGGSRTPFIVAALLVLCGGLYALYVPPSLIWFVMGCAIAGFYWNFVLPLILGLLAKIDSSGRSSILGGAMSSGGFALGPLFAGMLIHGSDYQLVGWMALGLCVVGLVCIIMIEPRQAQNSLGAKILP